MRKRLLILTVAAGLALTAAAGCGSAEKAGDMSAPEIEGLPPAAEEENSFAEGFRIYDYEKGVKAVCTENGRKYLLLPEGEAEPEGIPENTVVLHIPVDGIYLAATSAMALFNAVDGLDSISFSGTAAENWYVDEAREAMERGDILYAGKYSMPDYEALISGGCSLAVESMMILHSPEVQEKLEELDIPVFVDESSLEKHPLGRTEWIRVYGAMLGKDKEAEEFLDTQAKALSVLEETKGTDKTVAFFFINSAGTVVVRRTDDYIPEMIRLAGGEYIFNDLKSEDEDSSNGSVNISMEEFYAAAKDADYLIYNGTIDAPLESISDLMEKSSLFGDFKAVQEGRVYSTDKYMYQATDIMGELVLDFHRMLTGADGDMVFLKRIE